MAPVVQIPVGSKVQEKPKKPGEKRPELFCRVKYCNNLPDIPFDPKCISYPFDTDRFVQYKQTSLEKNYKHDLLTEPDIGVTIDLINPETYEITDPNMRLTEEDEKLLEDEVAAPQDTKRSRCHNRAITWLKKTEYISTEFNRYGASSDKTETKVGFGVKKKIREENYTLDRESQILAINKTFEAAKKPILSHPGKPGVKPVDIMPIFPDFESWKFPFAQVIFDADPAPPEQIEEMSQAMIRGVMDETGQQFVAYFLPTEDTMNKRKIDQLEGRGYLDGEEYQYTMSREYNWNVKNKATKGYEESYFFVWKDGSVVYNELETRVKLSKRRGRSDKKSNSRLFLKHRPMNEQEMKVQEIRLTQLEPPQEDEDMHNLNMNLESAMEMEGIEEAAATNAAHDEPGEAADDVQSEVESEKSKNSDSDSENEKQQQAPTAAKRQKVASESEKSFSSAESSSESDSDEKASSSSSDESDNDDHQRKRKQAAAEEIFGSDSDSE